MTEEEVVEIDLDDLATAWRTLMAVSSNYKLGSQGQANLIEARRLIEVEVRVQHGDEAWTAMRDGNATPAG